MAVQIGVPEEEDQGLDPLAPAPGMAPSASLAAGSGGAAPLPAPAVPAPTVDAPADSEEPSSTSARTSENSRGSTSGHSVAQTVASPEVIKATEAKDAADAKVVENTEKSLNAGQKLEDSAIAAERERMGKEAKFRADEAAAKAKAASELAKKQDAADAAEAAANDVVKNAQDLAINGPKWTVAGTGVKILQALLRAASVRNSYILHEDPNNNPVSKMIDAATAEEKQARVDKYLQSKEWRETIKGKSAEQIARLKAQQESAIGMMVAEHAQQLLTSEKTDALKTRADKNDPTGAAFTAARDLAVNQVASQKADDKAKFALNFAAKEEKSGSSTQSGKTSDTNTEKTGGVESVRGKALKIKEAEKWVPDPDTGKPVPVPKVSAEEASKARASYAQMKAIENLADRATAFISEHGVRLNSWDPRIKNEWELMQNEASGIQAHASNDGTLKAFNAEKLTGIFGGSGIHSLFQSEDGVKKALSGFKTNAKNAFREEVKSLNPDYAPSKVAPSDTGAGRRGTVNGKPATIYPDGTYEAL